MRFTNSSLQALAILDLGTIENNVPQTETDGLIGGRRQKEGVEYQLAFNNICAALQVQAHTLIKGYAKTPVQGLECLFLLGMKLEPTLFTQVTGELEQVVCRKVKVELVSAFIHATEDKPKEVHLKIGFPNNPPSEKSIAELGDIL